MQGNAATECLGSQRGRDGSWLRHACCAAALGFALCLGSANPGAALSEPSPPNDDNGPGPDLVDAYNFLAGTDFEHNGNLNDLAVANSRTWTGDGVAVIISSSAENHNDFGTYPVGNPSQRTGLLLDQTGFGFLGPSFESALFFPDGEVGFYLETSGHNEDIWHSESEFDDGIVFDHLQAYTLPDVVTIETTEGPLQIFDGWLLGWEDLTYRRSDGDYDDLIVAVGGTTSQAPLSVPEPASALLVASGLVATRLWRSRSQRRRATLLR